MRGACFANSAADLASVAFNESLVLWEQHRSNEAMERVREARAGFVAAEVELPVAWCDQNLGVLLAEEGRLNEAADRFVGAQDRYRASSHWTAVAWCDANLAIVLDALGDRSSR